MDTVLVLNADYTPLTLCSVERAFLLVYLNKVEVLSDVKEKSLRSIHQTFLFPSVIKVKKYISMPYKGVVLTRHNIFKRDQFACQYCGTSHDLTLDHLIPKSKGGKSTWTNLVTACKRCNSRKGDFKPEDVGLTLARVPFRPSYAMFIKISAQSLRTDWLPYLDRKASA